MEETIDLKHEPVGEAYNDLLSSLRVISETALLVVRDELPLSARGRRILEQMRPWFVRESRRSSWPGTSLLSSDALVKEFSLDEDSVRKLGGLVEGLYGWKQPDAPEDLCLLRTDGSPTLVTIAHECDAYLSIRNSEGLRIKANNPVWELLLKRLT